MPSFKTLLETPECNILNYEKISSAKIKKKYLAAAKQENPPAPIKGNANPYTSWPTVVEGYVW